MYTLFERSIFMKEYERLEQIRKEHGYSIKYIAVLLNATPKQVRKWEKGESKMKLSKYITLAKFYNLSMDYIAGLTDEKTTIK